MLRCALPVLAAGVGILVVTLMLWSSDGVENSASLFPGDKSVPLEFEVVNPWTVPGMPVVVRVTIRNTLDRACTIGDPGIHSDALRLYIAKPGRSPSGMYSYWVRPNLAGYTAPVETVTLEAGGELERYFFVDPPPGNHEIWINYIRQPGEPETTARQLVASLSEPTAADQTVEKILGLSRPKAGKAAHAASELREIIESDVRTPVRMLALAALTKVLQDELTQGLVSIAEDLTELESYRIGAHNLLRRPKGDHYGPIRPHEQRPAGAPWD